MLHFSRFHHLWQRCYQARLTNTVTSPYLWTAHLSSLPFFHLCFSTARWDLGCTLHAQLPCGEMFKHSKNSHKCLSISPLFYLPLYHWSISHISCITCSVEMPRDVLYQVFPLVFSFTTVSSLAPLQTHSLWQAISFSSRMPHSHIHHRETSVYSLNKVRECARRTFLKIEPSTFHVTDQTLRFSVCCVMLWPPRLQLLVFHIKRFPSVEAMGSTIHSPCSMQKCIQMCI